MTNRIRILFCAIALLAALGCKRQGAEETNRYTIQKENGQIILAFKAFEVFLNSDNSWESYQTILLDAYPDVQIVHKRQVGWGVIDTITFPEEIGAYERADYESYFSQYDTETLNYL